MKKRSYILKIEERVGYAFLLPSMLGVTMFILLPILMSFFLGFTMWNPVKGLASLRWSGLENYLSLFKDARVTAAIGNNLTYSFTYVPCTVFLALIIATLLDKVAYAKVPLRMMVFMPYISSLVSVATVWMVLLYPNMGPVNAFLHNVLKVERPPTWFISSTYALPGIIMMAIWHDIGYYMIIILAHIQLLPHEVYESAKIDGANALQVFFRITVPMLKNALFFCITLATINSFKVFDAVNIITEGGPGYATTVLVQSVYHYAFKEFRITYASAISLVLFIIIFIFSALLRKLENRLN